MASGAAPSAVSPATMAGVHYATPMVGVSGGSARSRRRTTETAPSPARFTPAGPTGANPTEDLVANCINDHAERLKQITANLTTANVKLEQHEVKTGMLDAAVTDIAERLREMERRETEKESQLVEKLREHEAQTTNTHEIVNAMVQRLSESGSSQASADDRFKSIDAFCDQAFKRLENLINEVDLKHQGQGETLHGNVHSAIAQLGSRVAEMEAAMRMWSQAGNSGPAPAPQAFPGTNTTGMPAPTQTASGVSFGHPAGLQAPIFPQFDPTKRSATVYQQMGGSGGKPIFDEKTAVAPNMQFRPADRLAWIKTTQNYLIGKAPEMTWLLAWAESAQERTITAQHVAATSSFGHCFDTEPVRLSHELWTYLNLALGDGKEKQSFHNVERSNGFEAWRKLVVPTKPRSKARVHLMHRDVHHPPMSKNLQEVMADIDTWEGHLTEFVACGGPPLPEMTKVISAMGILPKDTPTYIKMCLKDVEDLESFKDSLRQNIQFLNDFSGRGSPAHVVETPGMPRPGGAIDVPPEGVADEITVDDLPAHVVENIGIEEADKLVLAVNAARRGQRPPGRFRPGPRAQPKRAATPPRDAKDIKCGNCGLSGHSAQQCTKPRIPMEERKCHVCGKPGHIARNCPDAKKANVAEQAPAASIGRVLCMEDDDGYTTVVRRAQSRPVTLGDMPVVQRTSQGDRKRSHGNRFGALEDERPSISSKETEIRRNSQRPGRSARREELKFCTEFSAAPGREGECLGGCPCNPTAVVEPANVRETECVDITTRAQTEVETAKNDSEEIRSGASSSFGRRERADEVWELVDDAISENERMVADPPWPPPPAMDPFNLYAENYRGNMYAHCAEGQWELLKQLAISEGNRHSAAVNSTTATHLGVATGAGAAFERPVTRDATCRASAPIDRSCGGCTPFSNEPNTNTGPLLDSATWRSYRAEQIRQQINPRELIALESMGMADEVVERALLMESDGLADDHLLNMEWTDIDVEIALDSGCCDHIMDVEELAPGYAVMQSERSKRGAGFIVGNGERLANDGEAVLNLEAQMPGSQGVPFRSTFQAAKVTRPLMSVSKICRNGFKCSFDDSQALILDEAGAVVCRFVERNGIYLTTVKLKSPSPFGGPAR